MMGAGGGGARRGGPAGRDRDNTPDGGSYKGVILIALAILLLFLIFVILG